MTPLHYKRGDKLYRFALWNSTTGQFSYSEWIVKRCGPHQMTLISPKNPELASFVKYHTASHEKRFMLVSDIADPVTYGTCMSGEWIEHRCKEYEQQLNMRDTSSAVYIVTRADLDSLRAQTPSCGEFNELRAAMLAGMKSGL